MEDSRQTSYNHMGVKGRRFTDCFQVNVPQWLDPLMVYLDLTAGFYGQLEKSGTMYTVTVPGKYRKDGKDYEHTFEERNMDWIMKKFW